MQHQAGLGFLGNNQNQAVQLDQEEEENQEENVDNQEEEENPNAQWDLLAAQNAPMVVWGEWPEPPVAQVQAQAPKIWKLT